MSGEIQSSGLFLHRHQLLSGKLRDLRQTDLFYRRSAGRTHGKKVHLSLHVVPPLGGCRIHNSLVDLYQLGSARPSAVKRPGANQVLDRPLIHVAALHSLAKIVEGLKWTRFPFTHNSLDKTAADVLDGHQAEANPPLLHGEAISRAVDIRLQQGNPALLALVDIARYFLGIVQHGS